MSSATAHATGPVGLFSIQTTDRIQRRVNRLVRAFRLTAEDALDLTQSLYLRLLTACRRARITGPVPDGFAVSVIRMWYLDAGRKAARRKRRERRTAQLSALFPEIAELCGRNTLTDADEQDERRHLHRAVATLALEDQELAHRVARGSSAQVARERGVCRGTVTRQVQRLRDRFENLDKKPRA